MFCEKNLVLVILAAFATVVLAKPSGIMLSIAKDMSICRTVVDYDEAEDRIPRLIKVLKCAAEPYRLCAAPAAGHAAPCCGRSAPAGPLLTCAQELDDVLVSSASGEVYITKVPVGCVCIQQEAIEASELK